jgi:hypothetical protein
MCIFIYPEPKTRNLENLTIIAEKGLSKYAPGTKKIVWQEKLCDEVFVVRSFSFIDYNIFQSIQFEASTEDSLGDSAEEFCISEEEDISASELDEYSEILDKLMSCALESADEIADASLEDADETEGTSSAEEAALLTS